MQLAGIRHDEREAMEDAKIALGQGNEGVARGHVAIALQFRAQWHVEHGKYANLNQTIISLRTAEQNVETTRLFHESAMTLGALRGQMGDVGELMEDIQEQVAEVTADSEVLAVVLDDVEAELALLIGAQYEAEAADLEFPRVPEAPAITAVLVGENE